VKKTALGSKDPEVSKNNLKEKVVKSGNTVKTKTSAKLSKLTAKERNDLIDQLLKDLGYAE
jgi:hypothetical protein